MKKLLLSLAIAAVATPVMADDYVLYIGTHVENGEVVDYAPVEDGKEYVITPELIGIELECASFLKAANNTASDVTCVISPELVYNNNVNNGLNLLFQTCMGSACQPGEITVTIPAGSETPGGKGEHIGYTAIVLDPSLAEGVVFDAKHNVTAKMGNYERHFTLWFSSKAQAVETLDVAAGEAEYFNLQGMRVAAPADGEIYIVRQGGKTFKTIYRR